MKDTCQIKEMPYGLNDKPEGIKTCIYAFQFLLYAVANSAVVSVIVGLSLGLDGVEISALVQRTFFYCAVASSLQVLFGHRYPIFEGPAGMWYSVFIALGAIAPSMGKPLETLRTDLEFGLLMAAGITMLMGLTGLMGKIVLFFTPIVNGTFLLVMAFQVNTSLLNGMLGIIGEGTISFKAVLVSFITIMTTFFFTLKGNGWLKSINILLGVLVGWVAASIMGLQPVVMWEPKDIISFPGLFSWGKPTYDPVITLICVLAGFIVLSNLVASIVGMAELTGTEADARRINRGALFTGISDLLAGAGSVVGFIPYASAIGFVAITGVASRLPFIISNVVLAALALFPLVGNLFASIPPAVGYSVLFVTFSQIAIVGINNYARSGLDSRSGLIIGVSLMLGVGIMTVPQDYLDILPLWARYFFGNGLILGTLLSLILDNFILPAKKFS